MDLDKLSSYNITLLDILRKKAEMEKKGAMSKSLAACFSRATEILRSKPDAFTECQLVLQGEGECVTIQTWSRCEIHVIWYDQHKQVIQYAITKV